MSLPSKKTIIDRAHQDYLMTNQPEEKILRVSGGSNATKVASAIAHGVYDEGRVDLRCIGAAAVNQAVKAIAIARGYAAPKGYDLTCVPGFATIKGTEGDISAMILTVTPRRS